MPEGITGIFATNQATYVEKKEPTEAQPKPFVNCVWDGYFNGDANSTSHQASLFINPYV